MYIPKHYTEKDKDQAIAFMQRFHFGTIISNNKNRPIATHLPFVISEKKDQLILSAHFAKANEQWSSISTNDVLVIFTEPHAYVSPTHYNKKQNVPTWNYLAVHAYGQLKIVSEQNEVFKMLEQMMLSFEPAYKKQWNELSLEYKSGMANGIVAFEIEVTELQFQKKLSQNKKENERQNIINSFSKSADQNENMIAKYMNSKSNH